MDRSLWGERYYPFGLYWRGIFGEKVYKLSVSVAETCPVRDQSNSRICIFCDELGSAAFKVNKDQTLISQITEARERVAKRFRARKFLVYFQAYTNTFDRVETLERRFELALAQEGVCGLVLGTRPDCLPKRLLPVLRRYAELGYLLVELGAQSFSEEQLLFLRRGHTVSQTERACRDLAETAGVDIGLHLMFGLPGETAQAMRDAAQAVNRLPIKAVKLHNLHVLAGTPLAELHGQGSFEPASLETYRDLVIHFLRALAPEIAVQRLAATANRHDELVAPEWTRFKMLPTQVIRDELLRLDAWQGDQQAI